MNTSAEQKMPVVSIILPTYNRAGSIDAAVASVLNQTYTDFELIIVDDGSTDGTEYKIAGIKDERIVFHRIPQSRGAAAARNSGLRLAKGQFIAFQDSDDLWDLQKLSIQMEVFDKNPGIHVVYSDMWRIMNGRKLYYRAPDILRQKCRNNEFLCYAVKNIGLQSVIAKRECFDIAGDFDDRLPRFIDLELLMRFSCRFPFYHIRKPLVYYHQTPFSISGNNAALVKARRIIMKKYSHAIRPRRKLLSLHLEGIGMALCSNSRFLTGRRYLIIAAKLNPLNLTLPLKIILSHFPVLFCWIERVYKEYYKYLKI